MEFYLDFDTSVQKALKEIDSKFMAYPGFVICGTHEPKDTEKTIELIRQCRLTKTPLLGLCFGHQLCAIEWARANGIPDATSEEFGEGTFVVKKLPELNVGMKMVDGRLESFWNNYEVVIEWEKPDNFFTAQFHPEYSSSIDDPHPLLVDYINYAKMAV